MIDDKFKSDLRDLINTYSVENECDMPDYILASMVCSFIESVGTHIKRNLDWHGCDSVTHPFNPNITDA